MLFDHLDPQTRRKSLRLLADYVLGLVPNDEGAIWHNSGTHRAASWLIRSLNLGTNVSTNGVSGGVKDVLPIGLRDAAIAGIPLEELPLVEDAFNVVLDVHDFYHTITPEKNWPPTIDPFTQELCRALVDLDLLTAEEEWTETALPLLIRASCFVEESMMEDPLISDYVRLQAKRAFATLPEEVVKVLKEDEERGMPGARLAFVLGQTWRFGTWLSAEERKVEWSYHSDDPLNRSVAKELLALRGVFKE